MNDMRGFGRGGPAFRGMFLSFTLIANILGSRSGFGQDEKESSDGSFNRGGSFSIRGTIIRKFQFNQVFRKPWRFWTKQ